MVMKKMSTQVKIYLLKNFKLKNLSVNFSVNGDQIISGGNDKQVIIWKTNFDQQPAEGAKAKSPKKTAKKKSALEERIVADIGPPLGEPDPVSRGLKENETEIEQLEERQMAPQVERT